MAGAHTSVNPMNMSIEALRFLFHAPACEEQEHVMNSGTMFVAGARWAQDLEPPPSNMSTSGALGFETLATFGNQTTP